MKFWQVDAFSSLPFMGNPAALFFLEEPQSDQLMQQIALEMNLPETAFILLRKGKNPYLRWFTPVEEVDLCGHATLAAAHIYLEEVDPSCNEVTFVTKWTSPLKVRKSAAGYTMDFPLRPGKKVELSTIPSFVFDALSKEEVIEAYQARDLMLVYDKEESIYAIDPDCYALREYKHPIIVTAKSNRNYDFVSRFFSPKEDIFEDPVTGSAYCTSAPYWSRQLGKYFLQAYQASKRGGELTLYVTKDHVEITGNAVTVMEGKMRL